MFKEFFDSFFSNYWNSEHCTRFFLFCYRMQLRQKSVESICYHIVVLSFLQLTINFYLKWKHLTFVFNAYFFEKFPYTTWVVIIFIDDCKILSFFRLFDKA